MTKALTNSAASPQSGLHATVAQALERVAIELELARQAGARLEQSLCTVIDARDICDERMQDLQTIDELIQHLGALRDFLCMVALSAPDVPLPLARALEQVRLNVVRERLAGNDADKPSNCVEFFT